MTSTAQKSSSLISVPELKSLLYGDQLPVIIDCRFSLSDFALGKKQYQLGHLPGAHYAHLNDDLAGPVMSFTGRHPLPECKDFIATIASWGITADSTVIVYDDMAGAIAARAWWMLKYWLGHNSVALLDGGIKAWKQAGLDLSEQEPLRVQTTTLDTRKWRCSSIHISTSAELAPDVMADGQALLDARSAERFNGENEPIDPVAGHVPGAINMPFEINLNEDSCLFLPAEKLRNRFMRFGKSENTIHMCGSGVTAYHNMLAMEIAGFNPGNLYVGSWSEWITDTNRPVGLAGEK